MLSLRLTLTPGKSLLSLNAAGQTFFFSLIIEAETTPHYDKVCYRLVAAPALQRGCG